MEQSLALLRAAGENTRLRVLLLLLRLELTVTDLMEILGQSQPRISRHLKLLTDAGLVVRHQEGTWAYFRLADTEPQKGFLAHVLNSIDPHDAGLARDLFALDAIEERRNAHAAAYFAANAEGWDKIRSLHVAQEAVEERMLEMGLAHSPNSLLDLGTGTGRIIQLFADHLERAVGVDSSPEMLAIARSSIASLSLNASVRRGDLSALRLNAAFDLTVLHLVLHYLDRPQEALEQAAAHMSESGRLLIADFAPHELEFLRSDHAHRRLGIARDQLEYWLAEAGLEVEQFETLAPPKGVDGGLVMFLCLARKIR